MSNQTTVINIVAPPNDNTRQRVFRELWIYLGIDEMNNGAHYVHVPPGMAEEAVDFIAQNGIEVTSTSG